MQLSNLSAGVVMLPGSVPPLPQQVAAAAAAAAAKRQMIFIGLGAIALFMLMRKRRA